MIKDWKAELLENRGKISTGHHPISGDFCPAAMDGCVCCFGSEWLHKFIENLLTEQRVREELLSKTDLKMLADLRELCIDDDLLDLASYDSFARSEFINNAWEALKVIEKLLSNNPKQ